MSYCINPNCPNPQNPDATKFCLACGAKLLLKERYRATRPIGAGGFGRTFLAVDEDRLNAACVIKQFMPQFQGTAALQKATELFSREAVQLFELGEHPQIPSLHAYFEQDKRLYLVQEFVDGQNLLQELQQGAFSEQQIRELLLDLLPILQFIHERGVIHRDIKPDNILRRKKDGKLVLVDFGVAKQGSGSDLAKTGTRTGTQGYAPMEQLRGGQAYPASDLYSLGVTCIVLLARKMPDELYDTVEGEWVWRSQLAKQGRSVSDRLGKVIDKMLPDLVRDRYQSAAEVLRDLNAAGSAASAAMPTAIAPPPPVNAPVNAPAKPPQIQPPPANKPAPPTTAQPRKLDIITAELESVKSEVSQGQPAKPAKPAANNPPPPPNKPAGYDPILAELESLKTEYGENS